MGGGKEEVKEVYDKLSKFYDFFGLFEKKYHGMALELLNIKKGEIILEVGFGPGYCLEQIVKKVGKNGKAYGIDISPRMLKTAKKRLEKAGLAEKVDLYCGDATKLPYENKKFDAVFMSFTLELFDVSEIPEVLNEIRRVLKQNGRIGVVGMSKENGQSKMVKLYEWFHKKFPKYVDCRPIHVRDSVKSAGFEIKNEGKAKLFGLPLEIVVGVKKK